MQARRTMRGPTAVAALCATVWLSATGAAAPTYTYEYDAAGRLVRVGDGSGRLLVYDYEPGGDVRSTALARFWHVALKKPAKGAWVLAVDDQGKVTGTGADDRLGIYALAGTIDLGGASGGEVTGTVELRDGDSGALLGEFVLAKSKTKADRRTGAIGKLVLKSTPGDAIGRLKAVGVLPGPAFAAFAGRFEGAKSVVTVGATRTPLAAVRFVAEGTRPAVSRLAGALSGVLVRDPAGRAYGNVDVGAGPVRVTGRLKDGAKAVRLKSVRGAATRLKAVLRE